MDNQEIKMCLDTYWEYRENNQSLKQQRDDFFRKVAETKKFLKSTPCSTAYEEHIKKFTDNDFNVFFDSNRFNKNLDELISSGKLLTNKGELLSKIYLEDFVKNSSYDLKVNQNLNNELKMNLCSNRRSFNTLKYSLIAMITNFAMAVIFLLVHFIQKSIGTKPADTEASLETAIIFLIFGSVCAAFYAYKNSLMTKYYQSILKPYKDLRNSVLEEVKRLEEIYYKKEMNSLDEKAEQFDEEYAKLKEQVADKYLNSPLHFNESIINLIDMIDEQEIPYFKKFSSTANNENELINVVNMALQKTDTRKTNEQLINSQLRMEQNNAEANQRMLESQRRMEMDNLIANQQMLNSQKEIQESAVNANKAKENYYNNRR